MIDDPRFALNLSMEAYQSFPAISRSQIVTYLESPELYYATYISRTEPAKEYSQYMRFGNCIDEALSSGQPPSGELPDGVVQVPAGMARNTAHAKYRQFLADNPGCDPWTQSQVDEYHKPAKHFADIWAQIEAHEMAHRLLTHEDRIPQPSYFVGDSKARPDFVIPGVCIPDVKTSTSVNRGHTAKKCVEFGVDIQSYMAWSAHLELTGEDLPVVLICIQSKSPWSVATYVVGNDDLEIDLMDTGRARFEKGMAGILEERWRPDGHGELLPLVPPSHVVRELQGGFEL